MALLFACPAELAADALAPFTFSLQIATVASADSEIQFNLLAPDHEEKFRIFILQSPHGINNASFSYETLSEVITLELRLDDADRADFKLAGLVGFDFQTNVELNAVKIILRPRPQGGSWSAAAPCFTLVMCWQLTANASDIIEIVGANGHEQLALGAAAAFELCASFSMISPPGVPPIGVPGLQLRFDLPSFSLSTAWVPLSDFIRVPDAPPLRLDFVLRWFGDLIHFDWNSIALPTPQAPQWEFPNLPLIADLPLGIGAKQASISLVRVAGRLVLDAKASGFFLSWKKVEITLPGALHLKLSEDGRYEFFATLYQVQYPAKATDPTPYEFFLPFDVLGLSADCWYFRAGLFSNGIVDGKHVICFEVLLEVGGLAVTRRMTRDDVENGVYRTDLRLLARDFMVMSNDMTGAELAIFRDVATRIPPFPNYDGKTVPALSFADDLVGPPPVAAPANDYGITFLDGEFRASERLNVLWRQRGLRFLRALAHDLLGRPAAGAVEAGESSTLYNLEIAWFAQATQIRLDWRDENAPVPHADVPLPGPKPPPAHAPGCWQPPPDPHAPLVINLPMSSSHGVDLGVVPATPSLFELPAIRLELARPGAQAIVIRQGKPGAVAGSSSLSHIAFFPAPGPVGAAAPPLARAMAGFSMAQAGTSGTSEAREVIDTDSGNRFMTLALGYAGQAPLALRTLGWAEGGAPRFLQTLHEDLAPLTSLIPAQPPAVDPGDPGCPGPQARRRPPTAFDFEAFGSPPLREDGWRLSIELVAIKSLFKMFKSNVPGQSVSFEIVQICETEEDGEVAIETRLRFRLGDQFDAEGTVKFLFGLRDLSLRVADGAGLAISWRCEETPSWASAVALPRASHDYWYSTSKNLFGLDMTVLVEKLAQQEQKPESLRVLTLSIRGGRFMLSMPDGVHILLRYTGLAKDALNFWASSFALGPGGLDLDAAILSSSITVQGLSRPFLLEKAALRMRSSKLDYLSVDASGKLPELLNEAPVSLTIAFAQREDGAIDLDEMHCELGDKDTPILSRGTRFTFEITNLTIQYSRETPGAERAFYFELSGSARFTPDGDEFDGGLLEDLKSARIEFLRAPLSDEFIKNLSLVVELKRPVTFSVFALFKMEIRSIGFEPWCTDFMEPGPAIIIGGQCEFAKAGDVVSADIKFHAMKIGMPARGDWMPQVFFDKLRVDISTAEGFHIGGRVDRYDKENLQGFAGEGTVQIPGFPEISAAFSFVRLRKDEGAEWQHAWFVAIAAAKISYQVGPLPLYLRQIGLGFGYRYTLPLIAEFDTPGPTLRQMIAVLMKALDEHHTLAQIDSWTPQPDSDKWSIALEGVFTLGTANTGPYAYNREGEQKLRTMVLQVLAAFRSDFTVFAGMKMWYPVSVDDFFEDRENMHRRPLASGFMIYSAPQNRFLAHAASGQDPYMGPKDEPVPEMIKDILRRSHFEATLLVEPGLIHGELGWPDCLMFDMSIGSLKLQCRGGVLFRLERDLLIQGTFFSAQGSVDLGGALDGGFIGVRVEAFVQVQFAARLMTAVYLANPAASNLYAALGLDLAVRFSISAWLQLEVGWVKITLHASFSINLQVVVAMELGWAGYGQVGFKGRAQISIGVFGRSVDVAIAVGVNDGGVDAAAAVLKPYMGSLLGPGEPPPMPGIDSLARRLAANRVATGVTAVQVADVDAEAVALSRPGDQLEPAAAVADGPVDDRFVSACVEGARQDGKTLWFVWIMPGPDVDEFYPPVAYAEDGDKGVQYANLILPQLKSENVFVWRDEWKAAGTGDNQIYIYPNRKFATSTQETGGALPADLELNLQRMITGSWLPKNPDDDTWQKIPFPFYWPKATPELVAPRRPPNIATLTKDERVYEQDNPNGAPNHPLDASHHYDSALMSAMNVARCKSKRRVDQALGNQNFLLQAFHDDLVNIAASTRVVSSTPVTPSAALAGLRDTGMLICVQSERMPDWIAKLGKEGIDYPRIAFTAHDFKKSFTIRPVIDAEPSDFSLNPPVFDKARAYFDEDVIALAWELNWGGQVPTVASGANAGIEHYLRAYRINFVDLDTQRVIRTSMATPTRCDVPSTEGAREQIDLRYRFTIGRADVFGGLASQQIGHVGATITPIAQNGKSGKPFTIELDYVPTLTPLPPDNAEAVLQGPAADGRWEARLAWRQLALPSRPGVAITRGWHLVLRPLRSVPLGAYPDEAVDVTDRGLMSATGQALIDGDILIELQAAEKPDGLGYTSRPPTEAENEAREAAEKVLCLRLHSDTIPGRIFDHRGIPQPAGSSKHQAALRFFRNRASAATRQGGAWRLFLRAVNQVGDDERLRRGGGVSGLVQVKLMLQGPAKKDLPEPQQLRALPHFEWPKAIPAGQVAEITAQAGPLQLPLATLGGELVEFQPCPGRARVVRVVWNALPSQEGDQHQLPPLQAFAAYDVYELRLDTLVNADCDPEANFKPEWTWLRRVVATDAAQAAQIPATMADVSNWEAQYPAYAYTVAKLASLDIPARDMTDCWPGWYSWDESQLRWPAPLPKKDFDKLVGQTREWFLLGRAVTRVHLHPYLTMLVGRMAERGGVGANALYDLQLIAGKPNAVSDPLKWLAANTEAVDPYGWAALAQLGLSATLTMRDPLAGMLLPQYRLREAMQEAIETVTATSKLGNEDIAAMVSGWRRQLMVELPIQYLRAYAAASGSSTVDDAALSMLQVTLRPVPESVASYLVFAVESIGAPGSLLEHLTDIRIDIRFAADGKRQPVTILGGDSVVVGDLFQAGDLVMLRDFSTPEHLQHAGPLLQRLEAAGMGLTPFADRATWPASLLPGKNPEHLHSPFGAFGQPGDLATILLKHQADTPIVAYLADAFLTSEDEEQRSALKHELCFNENPEAFAAYIRWAPRFFRTAPLDPDRMPPAGDGDRRYELATAIAQPKMADPLKIAADAKGRLSLTHFVEEEWAGERSYAVVTVGRYERLYKSIAETSGAAPDFAGTVPVLDSARTAPVLDSRRADVALARVRRLAAPTLLLARPLRTAEERYFHELIMSHAEATLSQQNVSVSRKLQFNDIVRSYLRSFLYPAWARNVARVSGAAPRAGLPQPSERMPGQDTTPYGIDANVDTLLAAAPQARWNSTRYVDAAEPFYYQQTLRYRATAATDIVSERKAVVLPSLPPDAVTPIGENPVSFGRRRLKPEWQGMLDEPVATWLDSSGHRITVRLPRLAESLTSQARSSYFGYECTRYTYDEAPYAPVGLAPDPGVRVLLLDQSSNATATIAQLVPRPDTTTPADARAMFDFTALSTDLAAAMPEIGPRTDWADGLYATFDVDVPFDQCVVAEPETGIAAVTVPVTLAAPRAEPLPGADELPAQGPLGQLAPLAARMTLSKADGTVSLAMTEPLTGPAWLCRPHLRPHEPAQPISQRDLALGLRLIADTERRKLAALVAFDCAAATVSNLTLLLRIEEAALAILLQSDRAPSFEPETLKYWAGAGITLWRRIADPETGQGQWEQITGQEERSARYRCVLCEPERATTDAAKEIRETAWQTLREGWIPMGAAFNPDRFDRLSAAVDRLAGLAYRRVPLRRPAVFIQRGNEERMPWPPQGSGQGDSDE